MSDLEDMDVMLGGSEYNPIEREIDQMTGFSNTLDREETRENISVRGCSSEEIEIRNMPQNRDDNNLARQIDVLTNEGNLRISREMDSLLNGVNSQIENAISMAISEIVIPQVQNVVENVLARQSERVATMSRRPHNSGNDAQICDGDNASNRDFQSHQNLSELHEESPYSRLSINLNIILETLGLQTGVFAVIQRHCRLSLIGQQ